MTETPGHSADCKRIANAARVAQRVWLRTGDAQTAMRMLDSVISDVDRHRKARAAEADEQKHEDRQ